jgi:HAD superfamily hydrolase (TIGR01509 family)
MTPSIEVILFDLGNVILPFNHYQIAEKLSRFSRKKEGADAANIFSYLFDFSNGAVNQYETGKISSQEFYQSLKKSFQLEIAFEQFVPIWNEIFTENVEVSEIIRSLKGKKKLGLISNTNPLHFDYALSNYPILLTFDKWILSHEVGFKKPAREIFQLAIDWASVKPEKILFIDDMETHVEAALLIGLQGIQFVSGRQLKEELNRKLNAAKTPL